MVYLNIFLLCLLIFFLFGLFLIQFSIIVPKVREYGTKSRWDGISGPHQFRILLEYKDICLKEGIPLFWYKIQLIIFLVTIVIFVMSFCLYYNIYIPNH